ncbi:hypothetical protein [Aeromonas hydrophila]|uniref:hypothetical protein n=1 Tax=Aeromonas hydrophila TaxID=644 RepID=UPI0005759700|nr:hypothetical protein [Aeromonas hydrophila]KHN50322.1 hypothetical protein OI72_20660 [Aeromonas hydrophila]OFC48190.1 hypothetical protein BA189_05070 [Aeromonas hydrophila]OFC49425.1 hypothetical protein BA188_20890 [Aeromonas hydrophila]
MKNMNTDDEYHRYIIRHKIELAAANEGVDRNELLWACANASTALVDALAQLPILNTSCTAVQELYNLINDHPATDIPNPWFVWNKMDEDSSPATCCYLKIRGYTNAASSLTSAVSGIGSLVTVVDIGSLAQNSNASVSTMAHLKQLVDIAKKHRESATIQSWLEVIIAMKNMKLAVRGGQLSAAALTAVPVLSIAMSIIGGTIATCTKLGIKLRFTNVCRLIAMELHWRARQETAILECQRENKGKGAGPAREILFELFQRRGVTGFIWGKHDIEKLIKEPAGWMAIADKLLII